MVFPILIAGGLFAVKYLGKKAKSKAKSKTKKTIKSKLKGRKQ